jgi:hypothetical protein
MASAAGLLFLQAEVAEWDAPESAVIAGTAGGLLLS